MKSITSAQEKSTFQHFETFVIFFSFRKVVMQLELTASDRKAERVWRRKQSEGRLFSLRTVFPIKPPHSRAHMLFKQLPAAAAQLTLGQLLSPTRKENPSVVLPDAGLLEMKPQLSASPSSRLQTRAGPSLCAQEEVTGPNVRQDKR